MKIWTITFLLFELCSCVQQTKKLPILGTPIINNNDTLYPTIRRFSLINQDGQIISNETFKKQIYLADFIFLSCPTICPKMTQSMMQAYIAFANDKRVAFISHSIDPEHDGIPQLKAYSNTLGIQSNKWHFVTGNQDSILSLAEHSYFSTAYPDSTAPGGFTHSGGLLLVDTNRHIRGVYNGTKASELQRLISDMQILLKELQ